MENNRGLRSDTLEVPLVDEGELVARPRVLALLDGVLTSAVTLVHAPAGCGKTTAVALWCARRKPRVAWLSLDMYDADPARFEQRMWSAAAYLLGQCDSDAQMAGPASGEPDAFKRMDAWANLLAETGKDLVVVLDNFDWAGDVEPVADGMQWLVPRLPGNVHLVLVSRSFPHVGLSRLRMDGILNEIGLDRLMFTRLDAKTFFEHAGVRMDDDQLGVVDDRLSGWPMAYRFFVRAYRRGDGAGDLESAALWKDFDRAVYDYLYDEMLRRLPDRVRTFLSCVSCLEGFCGSLASAVLQWSPIDVDYCLDALLDSDVVHEEGDDAAGNTWYSVAPLVKRSCAGRDMLRSGLRRKDVMARALEWLERHDLFDQAADCAAAARDWDGLAELVYRRWRKLFANDDYVTVRRWVSMLPEGYLESHPKLCMVAAPTLCTVGSTEQAFMLLRIAQLALNNDKDGTAGLYHACNCLCLSYVDAAQASAEASRALELLPDDEEHLRSMAMQVIGAHRQFCDPVSSRISFERSAGQLKGTGLRNPLCSALSNAAVVCALAGFSDAADRYAHQAEGLYGKGDDKRRPMLAFAYLAQAFSQMRRDDVDQTLECLKPSEELFDENALDALVAALHVARSWAAFRQGDAAESLAHARTALRTSGQWALRSFPPLTMVSQWCRDGLFSVDAMLSELGMHEDTPTVGVLRQVVRFAAGEGGEQFAQECGCLAAQGFDVPMVCLTASIVEAACYEREGMLDQAQAALQRAFIAAEPEGLVQPFLDDGALFEKTWRRLARTEPTSFAAKALKRYAGPSSARDAQQVQELLSTRELEVMRLASQGLSTQSIAEKLFVSRETAKKHMGNVYAKLGVHTRAQAVNALRQAGLL